MAQWLDPAVQFRADLLVTLAYASRAGRLVVTRVTFDADTATIATPHGDVMLDGSDRSTRADPSRAIGLVEPLDTEMAVDEGDLWSELLYDLGVHIDLLEAHEPGLAYRSIERDGARARVDLYRASTSFEFLVSLTELPIGLPETFHGWAHRYPAGTPEPIEI
jgi:hypothetical protein